jgi:hypothetical protein
MNQKNADGPLPCFHPSAVPDIPGKLRATRHGGRAGYDATRGELAGGGCAACDQIDDEPLSFDAEGNPSVETIL